MAKRIALKDHIHVDAVDLSNFARSVEFSSEHERVDVSGFNATGANEYLAGQTEQSVTVEFFGSYGASGGARDPIPDPPRPGGRRLRVAARPDGSRLGHKPATGRATCSYSPTRRASPVARRRRGKRTFTAADSARARLHDDP